MVGFGFGTGFGNEFSRFAHFSDGQPANQGLKPGSNWDGAPSSGFASVPTDPARTTAKPVCRLLTPPRQTVRIANVIGVFAAANNDGSLIPNLGLSHVDFHCEGNVLRVESPTFRTFERADGSTYEILGWWVTLSKPSGKEGIAHVYAEAVPSDGSMQSRISGPFSYLMASKTFDYDVTVAASGGADFLSMEDAFTHLRAQNAQHPRVRVLESGEYDLGNANRHSPAGWCRIEADAPVTFLQAPPALEGDFTRMRPGMESLHFKGPEITIDFVETLEFYTELEDGEHWLDGIHIVQSRGRENLWRSVPRNIIPALFRNGAWFTDCVVTDVNDVFDKAPLVRGCRTSATWADLAQDALCFVANEVEDHSSAFYYTNVDAMGLTYSGTGTATVSIRNSPRSLVLRVDGVDVASFAFDGSEQAFRDDTNYRVASAVDWVNSQTGWSAALLDDTRAGVSLSPPGTTNGGAQEDIAVPATLPTHFDIHSDIYQLPILPEFRENMVFAFNRLWQIDAQNIFIQDRPGVLDSVVIGNALYNNLGTPDEGLQSDLGGMISHGVFAHNTMATQRALISSDGQGGDIYSLIANNVILRMTVRNGDPIPPALTVRDNHVVQEVGLPAGLEGTSSGGDSTTLFNDAINGDFTPTGDLLINGASPSVANDLVAGSFPEIASKGALAAVATINTGDPLPSWSIAPSITGIAEVGETLTGDDGVIENGAVNDRQWLRGGLAIPGAINTSYTLVADDEATLIAYAVEATGPGGVNFAVSADVGPIAAATGPGDDLVLVDSVQGGGSAGSASATGLIASGANRQVFAMVGAGTSDAVSNIGCVITGTSGTVAMTRVFFSGTQSANPASSLEAFAGFVIDEANLPGDGPYDLVASATGANVPDKVGIVASSVANAPISPTIAFERSASITASASADGTLVLAGLGSSTATSGAAMTGATQVENLFSYGDGIQLGWAMADTGPLTVTNSVNGRNVSALVLFEPAPVT
ncbi:hypothetical protein EH31_16840 [Erythrobacter longus]|uniref:Uncharacterized protein n=1 Tax=Erythrobacter longus TaxID=1044 RepID=A0A074MSQ1_ERYLO|nr:hypothetical protein [Erythrobacter longus]KEO88622.1 hypothetical protein EH31_16840 [Erythrobacter longus]